MKFLFNLALFVGFIFPVIGFAEVNSYHYFCGVAKKVHHDDRSISLEYSSAEYLLHTPAGDLIEKKKKTLANWNESSIEVLLRRYTSIESTIEASKIFKKTPYICIAYVVNSDASEETFVSFSFDGLEAAKSDLLKQF